MTFDILAFGFLRGFAERFSFFNFLFVFLSTGLPYFFVGIFLILIFRLKNIRERIFWFLFSTLTVLISRGIFVELIKFFMKRERPYELLHFEPLFYSAGSALPSGHAAFLFAIAFVAFAINRRWGFWFFVFAGVNGLARVLSGVHWIGDIIFGVLVAFLSFLLVRWLLRGNTFFTKENLLKEPTA